MALIAPLNEAQENLRVIRQTMERSTKYSTLSGWSGIAIGLIALFSTWLSVGILHAAHWSNHLEARQVSELVLIWGTSLIVAVSFDFAWNKRRAKKVGKVLGSPLGAHIVLAALPGFAAGGAMTLFLYSHGLVLCTWAAWMLCYGLAISAVGLLSVRPVSLLGSAFVAAGVVALGLPTSFQPLMMALSFGGFHIGYGLLMARKYGW